MSERTSVSHESTTAKDAYHTFIPVAEETGLILPIGTWVPQEALRQVQQWRRELPGAENVWAAVNISRRQLVAKDFPGVVEAAIAASGIDPAAVHLEITETVLMDQPDLPKETLQRLSRLGVGLSIDDFGTGYSSLSYLKWLSARTLKIDRTFVEELGSDPHGATIIELVLGMADSMQLQVIPRAWKPRTSSQSSGAWAYASPKGTCGANRYRRSASPPG